MIPHSPKRSRYALRALLILLPIAAALLWTTPAFLSSINKKDVARMVGNPNASAHGRAALAATNMLPALPAPIPLPTVGPGVAPDGDPGGFGIEGDLRSNFPGADRSSDWVANPSPTPSGSPVGDYMLNNDGTARLVFPANGNGNITKHFFDGVGNADQDIFQSTGDKYNDNPTTWDWAIGKPPAKNDINHALLHQALDSAGNAWVIIAGDQGSSQGDRYIDFELLQKPIAKTCATPACTSGNFSSGGPNAGRTLGDLLLTVQLSNGGAAAQFFVYRWAVSAASPIGYDYIAEPVSGVDVFIAANTGGAVSVPFAAFGSNSYPLNTFAEAAVNLNALLQGFGFDPCIGIKTLFIKTKTSNSPSAQLKDFINPIALEFGSAPSSTITAADVCANSTGNTASVPDAGPGSTYNWSVTNGTITGGSGTNQITYTAGSSGTVQLSVTVNNKAGCGSTTSPPKNVSINPSPAAAAIIDATDTATKCAALSGPTTFKLDGTATNGTPAWGVTSVSGNILTSDVSFSAPALADTNVSIANGKTGAAVLRLRVTSSTGCGVSDAFVTVTVNSNPVAGFTNNTVCAGAATAFTNTSSGAATYLWNFGDGSTSTDTNPSHTYAAAGSYTVTLTASAGGGCSNAVQHSVTVNANPVAAFSAPAVCAGAATAFTNSSTGAASYSWDFGDGSSSTATNPSHTYAAAGTYTAVLTATSAAGCSKSISHDVNVNANPVAAFSAPAVCAGAATVFTNSSTGAASYSWNFGDGSSSTETSPSHTYAGAGTYTVTLTATSAAGCSTPVSHSVTVNANPVAAFSAPAVCAGALTAFTNSSTGAASYSWDFGDGSGSTETSPSHTYAAAGTYTAMLTATSAAGCSKSISHEVTVNANPVAAFSAPAVCAGSLTAFTNSSTGAASYSWNFGDGGSSTATNPSHTYAAAGTYTVQLTATSAAGCSNSISQSVTVNANPVAAFSAPAVCAGSLTAFTNSSTGAASYSWDFGDGSGSTDTNPSHTYAAAGAYTAVLTATSAAGCSTSVQHSVTVNANAVAAFSAPAVCEGAATVFTNSSTGAASYSWDFGDGSGSTATSPSHTYAAGTYTAVLTATSAAGCSTSVQHSVTVYANPTVTLALNLECDDQIGTEVTKLIASPSPGASYSYSWTGPDGLIKDENDEPINAAAITPTKPGIYTVVVTNPGTSCSVSGSYKLCFGGSQIVNQPVAAAPTQQPLSDSASAVATSRPTGLRAYLARVVSIFG
jgi:PKD repeat protein